MALILNDVHGKSNPDQIISGCLVMLIACIMLMQLLIAAPLEGGKMCKSGLC